MSSSGERHPVVQMGCSKKVSLVGHSPLPRLSYTVHAAGPLLVTNSGNRSHHWAERRLPWLGLLLIGEVLNRHFHRRAAMAS